MHVYVGIHVINIQDLTKNHVSYEDQEIKYSALLCFGAEHFVLTVLWYSFELK